MNANQLRAAFREYFAERGHALVPSASLIPHEPTLLFTNSGMVQFIPYFKGSETPTEPRAVTIQKCVRAGGKHNDLDEVGRTKRHLTFFEMMGNFSFGDYFKATAIPLAWEFFTEVLELDPERLWVTVHLTDDEAERIWAEDVGVPAQRIQRLDEDNWWRMGDTGPNGPCSEVFWDKGPEYVPEVGPANPEADERYVELWNLVFMQFETFADGTSAPLPKPSIDTGAGLERILGVLQGKDSVFEIDEMARLINAAEAATGYTLGADADADLALRVLAEHGRTTTFLVADGVFPSNEDRGYVLRRIIRRAVRFAYLLGVTDLVMGKLVDATVEIMGADYPEIVEAHDLIRTVIDREETQFRRTLANGLSRLEAGTAELSEGDQVDGELAFTLHDTYGFPYEVTAEVAAERGLGVDRAEFDVHMAAQRERAKAGAKKSEAALPVIEGVTPGFRRDVLELETSVYEVIEAESGQQYVVLAETCFYAESGGQIGDTGTIEGPTGRATVVDTIKGPNEVHFHQVDIAGSFEPGDTVMAMVDHTRRNQIRRHHTATHLLQWALKEVLGTHVQQQGSWVGPDRLRFDFTHFSQLTVDEIRQIEDLVNHEVLENPAADHVEVTKDEALEMGAIAFFGDKYGDLVRVLRAGPSLEFCGGTHVSALGDIGLLKVVSESSIGSNIRRIEAVVGDGAMELLRAEEDTAAELADVLKVPRGELVAGVRKRVSDLKAAHDEIDALKAQLATGAAAEMAGSAHAGVVIDRRDGMSRDELKTLAVAVRDRPGIRAVILGGAPAGGGAALVAATDPEFFEAGSLIGPAAKAISGGGGKGKDLAMAGGKNPEGIDEALSIARQAAGI